MPQAPAWLKINRAKQTRENGIAQPRRRPPTDTSQTPHRHLTDTSQTPHIRVMVKPTRKCELSCRQLKNIEPYIFFYFKSRKRFWCGVYHDVYVRCL